MRKLLLVARNKLTDRAWHRLEHAFEHGDPHYELEAAWVGRELLRDVYAATDLPTADAALDEFCDWADAVEVPELSRLAGTLAT